MLKMLKTAPFSIEKAQKNSEKCEKMLKAAKTNW